jgi:hypothetical protein
MDKEVLQVYKDIIDSKKTGNKSWYFIASLFLDINILF